MINLIVYIFEIVLKLYILFSNHLQNNLLLLLKY